jgi:hypothetical protein
MRSKRGMRARSSCPVFAAIRNKLNLRLKYDFIALDRDERRLRVILRRNI